MVNGLVSAVREPQAIRCSLYVPGVQADDFERSVDRVPHVFEPDYFVVCDQFCATSVRSSE